MSIVITQSNHFRVTTKNIKQRGIMKKPIVERKLNTEK